MPLLQHEIAALFETATAWGTSAFSISSFSDGSAAAMPARTMTDTDADAFTKTASSSMFFKDLKKRQSDYFSYGGSSGGIATVAKALDMRPAKK